jgi:hypothetical protein
VQALIAARLDTFEPTKSLLQDAAVLGKVFLGRRARAKWERAGPQRSSRRCTSSRKDAVRPARSSSMEGERYGFWHVLVRDVCYGQIPRAARAAATGRPPPGSRKAGERAEDLADVLAHHYQAALELNRAAGIGEQSEGWKHRRCTTWLWPVSGRCRSTSTRLSGNSRSLSS